ncbi:MAG TPA: hypothetical protein VNC23_04570 [Lapillicoccus sp.]|jgi:hypothetical protein|nr:hypothetical protein [Lapillicoccus sp.]
MRREPGEPAPAEPVHPPPNATPTTSANPRQWGPIRDAEGAGHVELFLVATVVTITVTRLYLQLTGFPQIGSTSGLHVAHVLFGGVFMLVAMVMFMLLLGRSSRWLATLLAGIGFGLFIDEVGKFLTQDNNYFFKPAAAVIYLFLVLVYLVGSYLVRRRALSDRELIVNGLKMMQELAAENLDAHEASELKRMLEAASPIEPLRDPLLGVVEEVTREPLAVGRINRFYVGLRRRAVGLTRSTIMQRLGVVLFQIAIVLSVFRPLQELVDDPSTFTWVWAVAACLVLVQGVVATVLYYRGEHVRALQIFALALTLELLVVQFFELLDEPWLGVVRVLVNVLLLGVCHSMLYREEHLQSGPVSPSP